MSESASINDVLESNGASEQATYNGESEEHTNKSPGSGEDKIPDSICDNGIKKNNVTPIIGSNNTNTTNRAKKRKKTPRDATAPKQPLTGYFRVEYFTC